MNQDQLLQRLKALGFHVGVTGLNERQQRKLFRRAVGIKRSEGRYTVPHQSKRECTRRRKQMAAALAKAGITDVTGFPHSGHSPPTSGQKPTVRG